MGRTTSARPNYLLSTHRSEKKKFTLPASPFLKRQLYIYLMVSTAVHRVVILVGLLSDRPLV